MNANIKRKLRGLAEQAAAAKSVASDRDTDIDIDATALA